MSTAVAEKELIRKLVTTWHLNVAERKCLPAGKARVSLMVDCIEELLEEHGCYPPQWTLEDDFGGAWIERLANEQCMVYFKAEYAMGRTAVIRQVGCRSMRAAAEILIREEYGDEIDGIPLQWDADATA